MRYCRAGASRRPLTYVAVRTPRPSQEVTPMVTGHTPRKDLRGAPSAEFSKSFDSLLPPTAGEYSQGGGGASRVEPPLAGLEKYHAFLLLPWLLIISAATATPWCTLLRSFCWSQTRRFSHFFPSYLTPPRWQITEKLKVTQRVRREEIFRAAGLWK